MTSVNLTNSASLYFLELSSLEPWHGKVRIKKFYFYLLEGFTVIWIIHNKNLVATDYTTTIILMNNLQLQSDSLSVSNQISNILLQNYICFPDRLNHPLFVVLTCLIGVRSGHCIVMLHENFCLHQFWLKRLELW